MREPLKDDRGRESKDWLEGIFWTLGEGN